MFRYIKLLNSQQQNTLGTITLGRENYSKQNVDVLIRKDLYITKKKIIYLENR